MNKNKPRRQKGKIFVLSGPSGSGKTTLHHQLLKNKSIASKLVKTISATTRKPRPSEKHGRDYLFFSNKEFFYRRRIGYFLEWKKVFDHYYGTPKRRVESWLKKGKNVLLCIDVQGAKDVFQKQKDAVGIFIKTRNLKILKQRLQDRGSETKDDFQKRVETAKKEMKEAARYKYVVINDDLGRATKQITDIILKEIKQED